MIAIATLPPGSLQRMVGGLDSIFLIASLSQRLPDAYQIAVWINDGKLPHPPRLVIEDVLARNASSGQLCQSKCPVNVLHV